VTAAAAPELVCTACGRVQPWSLAGICPACAGLLDVRYDLARARIGRDGPPLRRFRDLLPLRDEASLRDGGEGNTRCLHARELGAAIGLDALWVKVEGDNPTRTVKDRQAPVVIGALRELGVGSFVTASTGNSATAMARLIAGLPDMHMHVFVGDEFLERVAHPEAPNVSVYWLPRHSYVDACEAAGWFADQHGITREGGFFFFGKREGLKTVYLEAAAQVAGEIEVYIQAVSSGIGVYAVQRAAQELRALGHTRSLPRLVCVQEASCSPMARAFERGSERVHPDDIVARPRGLAKATFRGDPSKVYPYLRATVLASGGTMLAVDAAAIEEARDLAARTEGLDVCHSSAMTVAAAARMAAEGRLRRDAVVLLNLTGADRPPSTADADFLVEPSAAGWRITPAAARAGGVEAIVIEALRGSQQVPGDLALHADTVLLDGGLALDSVAVLELLVALEQRFALRIDEHEVTAENLQTVGALARLMATKIAAASRADA
jgi:threonine synthase